jgi:hypothetical protein
VIAEFQRYVRTCDPRSIGPGLYDWSTGGAGGPSDSAHFDLDGYRRYYPHPVRYIEELLRDEVLLCPEPSLRRQLKGPAGLLLRGRVRLSHLPRRHDRLRPCPAVEGERHVGEPDDGPRGPRPVLHLPELPTALPRQPRDRRRIAHRMTDTTTPSEDVVAELSYDAGWLAPERLHELRTRSCDPTITAQERNAARRLVYQHEMLEYGRLELLADRVDDKLTDILNTPVGDIHALTLAIQAIGAWVLEANRQIKDSASDHLYQEPEPDRVPAGTTGS